MQREDPDDRPQVSLRLRARRFVNLRLGARRRRLARRRAPALHDEWPQLRPPAWDEVLLLFGGDTHFEGRLARRLDREAAGLLTGLRPLFAQADVSIVNLETAVARQAAQAGVKDFHFRAPPEALAALEAAGVSIASMANNHAMDSGDAGLSESLAAAEASPVRMIGIGPDAATAHSPATLEVRGHRIAVLAVCHSFDRPWMDTAWPATDQRAGMAASVNLDRTLAAVADAQARADTVVVVPHWGAGGDARASRKDRELAKALVDSGADVVAGPGSHRPYSAGWLGDAFVCYGLGNFVWWRDGPGAVLAVWTSGREVREFRWIPCWRVDGVPQPLAAGAADAYSRYVQRNARADGLRLV